MSFGVVQSMIITLRNNARQRLKNSPFDRKKLFKKKWKVKRKFYKSNPTKEQLDTIKRNAKLFRQKEIVKNLGYFVFAVLILVLIWRFIIKNFDKFRFK